MDICGLSIHLIKQLTEFDHEEIEFMNNSPTMFEHIREMFNKIVEYHREESSESIRYWAHQMEMNNEFGLMALREKNIFELVDVIKRTKTMGCSEWVRHNAELIEMFSEQGSAAFRKLTSSIGRILYLSETQIDRRLKEASAFVGIKDIAQYEEPSSSSSLSSPHLSSIKSSNRTPAIAQSTPHTSETSSLTEAPESLCPLPVASPLMKSHFDIALKTPLTLATKPELNQFEAAMVASVPLRESHCQFDSSPTDVADIPLPSEPTCIFCSSSMHWSMYCCRFPNNASRMERIKQLGRCYHCLEPFNREICMQKQHWSQCKCGGDYSCHPLFCKNIDMTDYC